MTSENWRQAKKVIVEKKGIEEGCESEGRELWGG